MSLPVKLGVGLLGLSLLTVPGAWMLITSEPRFTTLAGSSSIATEYTGKFGEYFKYHLVDVELGKNESWWDWSFKYRWQGSEDSSKEERFKGISDGSALREKCKEFYKKETKDLTKNETANSVFDSLYKNEKRGSTDTLRNKCQEVYEKQESDSDTYMFCSLIPSK